MLTKFRYLCFGLAVVVAAGSAYGAKKKRKKRKKRKRKAKVSQVDSKGAYGLAGCGLGSMLFGAKPGFTQVWAATTNHSFADQTFAITSGTSNCDIPQMAMAAAAFIEVNREVVSKESARGRGEAVQSLAQLYRCSDAQYFGVAMQKNYGQIFAPHLDGIQSSRSITQMIRRDHRLARSCSPSLTKGS